MKLEFDRLSREEQELRGEQFLRRMRARRSVRFFSEEAVPVGLIETAIQTAATAPSGANQQPWRFVVVSDPDVKRKIREAAEAEERENYEHRFPAEWLEALAPFGTSWHKEYLETVPYLIVVFRIEYGEAKKKHYYVSESVGIAAGMLLAALQVAGLATLVHTPSPMGFLREILGRPVNERAMLLIPVGYPAADAEVPDHLPKKALDEVMVTI